MKVIVICDSAFGNTAQIAQAIGETPDSDWRSLYIIGGVAELIAGTLSRRNLAAEISLFSVQK